MADCVALMSDGLTLMTEDCTGAWPGDHPYPIIMMPFSSAVLRVKNFTIPMHEVQMVLALSSVFFE